MSKPHQFMALLKDNKKKKGNGSIGPSKELSEKFSKKIPKKKRSAFMKKNRDDSDHDYD